VTSADGDSFAGSVKVKLGPIALVYNGSGTFVEKDEAAHRFVVDAKGKDKRGNGTAGANVTLTMADSADGGVGSTDVEVVTDLSITGKPAQFGRGVMQDVSDKLLGQFVACLEQRLAGPPESGDATDAPPGAASLVGNGEPVEPPVGAAAGSAAQPPPAPPSPPAGPPKPPPRESEALDLGSAVLPVLAKSYWRQALAALVVLVLLRRLLRRS
jgi:carbon monoxide dehydrogenase subunit G